MELAGSLIIVASWLVSGCVISLAWWLHFGKKYHTKQSYSEGAPNALTQSLPTVQQT